MSIPYLYQEIEQLYSKTLGQGLRTLAVMASTKAEGTSSVAGALAQRAIAVGKKVLVVDLNLHNPHISNQLQSQDIGATIPQQLKPSHGPEYSVMPVPQGDKGLLELREQAILAHNIEHWTADYDLVIFDTSPLCQVNRRNIPAQLVAGCCDGAILVIRSGKTEAAQLGQAMATLSSLNVNLLGTVINDYSNPSLGQELVRQCCKLAKTLPKTADWLIDKINTSKFLFARF